MDCEEKNKNEKYEQEILKAHEKLFPRKKRIAHNSPNSHYDNVPNELLDKQNLMDLNELLGVQDVDFEKLQPLSKSRCVQKGKMKSSFPLLKKSQKHLKYIRHNVGSASKQRAHVSLSLGENNTITDSSKNEELDQSDYRSEYFEGFYTQGIAESVKSRGRFKPALEKNSMDCNKDNNLKIKLKLNCIDSEIRNDGKKEYEQSSNKDKCKFKDTNSVINEDKSNRHKDDSSKHKNRDNKSKDVESSKIKGTSKKHKHKEDKDSRDKDKERSRDKDKERSRDKDKERSRDKDKERCRDKDKERSRDKDKERSKDKSKNCDIKISKHKDKIHKYKDKSKHKYIQNSTEKDSEKNSSLKEKVKLKSCSVRIEQCPEISFMLRRDVSLPSNSQNKEQSDEMRIIENDDEAILTENELDDDIPLEANGMDDSSDDDIMVIEERPSQFNVKIAHTFSIKQECDAEKECETESVVAQTELENSASQEVIDLSDDNMSECEIEIINVKAGNECDTNILKKVEKSNDNNSIASVSKQISSVGNFSNVVNNVLSENEVSSCTSKSIAHSVLSESDNFDETSLKAPFKNQILKSGLTNLDLKLDNVVKCEENEDEIDESISKILDLEGVSEPSISPLIQLFEKESRDLKNIQNAARNYSNVAEGLKMLECEKLKRLKYMKCALKKIHIIHNKQNLGNKITLNQKNEVVSKNTLGSKPSINTAVNEYFKNDEQLVVTENRIIDPCSSIPTVENYASNFVSNSSSSRNSDDDELEVLNVYNRNSPVSVNSIIVQNPIVSPNSLLEKGKAAFERNNEISHKPQIDVFKSPYSFTSNTIPRVPKPAFSSFESYNTQEVNTFGQSPISRNEISQPISSSTLSVDKVRLSDFNSYSHPSQDRKVSSAFGQFCQVCRKKAVFACQGCSKVFFCSNECGIGYWNKGHFAECR